ncbi:MAG: hypothetical protein L3K18_09410 [Thermoplasmata archaeon]|nr:hypothetical protein [Thermoplasmata archaeon]
MAADVDVVTCGAVRAYLASVRDGRPDPSPPAAVWDALLTHRAIEGSPAAPTLTDVGGHVLKELDVRAVRTDPLPLNAVAEQLSRVGSDLENVAKSASYFLAELGPVVPIEALPLLRIVAVDLANRRETAEEIAEGFRNVWGSVEVMGGDARDRLLAAEILDAESASIEKLFASMMRTTEMVRSKGGEHSSAVAVSAILHLAVGPGQPPALDSFLALRPSAGSDEAAALLAATGLPPAEAAAARDRWRAGLPPLEATDALHAATYLATFRSLPPEVAARVNGLVPLLAPRFARPGTAAALLATSAPIDVPELMNWLEKAELVARARKLAPTPQELDVLALALVHGLPATEFTSGTGAPPAIEPTSASLVSLHAWLYRPLTATGGAKPAPTPAR